MTDPELKRLREVRDKARVELQRLRDECIHNACELATRYGGIDGAHHKQWLIDQMLRVLLGPVYAQWVHEFNSDADYDNWETGTAP